MHWHDDVMTRIHFPHYGPFLWESAAYHCIPSTKSQQCRSLWCYYCRHDYVFQQSSDGRNETPRRSRDIMPYGLDTFVWHLISWFHYSDVILDMASQITNITIFYTTVYSDADQRKHLSYASLAFVRRIHRWPVNSPHKLPVARKCFHFITSSCNDSFAMLFKQLEYV